MDTEKFKSLYAQGVSIKEMSKILGVGKSTISIYRKSLDLPMRNKRVDSVHLESLITEYKKGDLSVSSLDSDISYSYLLKKFKSFNVDVRLRTKIKDLVDKHKNSISHIETLYLEKGRQGLSEFLSLDYNSVGHFIKMLGLEAKLLKNKRSEYLSKITLYYNPFTITNFDSKSAYILGYILGDGSLLFRENRSKGRLNISSKDLHILESFKHIFNLEQKGIRLCTKNSSTWYSLDLYDFYIPQDLYRLGVRPNKSKNGCTYFCDVSFLPHLLRGVFDSDGCVSYHNNLKNLRVSICGHASYLLKLKEDTAFFNWKVRQVKTLTFIELFRQDDITRFYNYIYPEGIDLFLFRKKEVFDGYFGRVE